MLDDNELDANYIIKRITDYLEPTVNTNPNIAFICRATGIKETTMGRLLKSNHKSWSQLRDSVQSNLRSLNTFLSQYSKGAAKD